MASGSGIPFSFFVLLIGGGAVFGVLLGVFLRICGCTNGWKRLGEHYTFKGTYQGNIKLDGGQVDTIRCEIGADQNGLYLIAKGQNVLLIPWTNIRFSAATYCFGQGLMDLEIDNIDDVTVSIDRKYENVIRETAGNQWPGITENL